MNRNTHYFLRSVILLGFGLFIIKLLISGDIQKFIAPRMMPYMYFALGVIAILGMIQFFKSDSEDDHDCDCGHDHDYSRSKVRSILVYSLFIIPIFTGMLFSDHVLGSSQASNKGFKYQLNSASPSDDYEKSNGEANESNSDSSTDALDDPAILTTTERYPELQEKLSEAESFTLTEDDYIGTISLLEEQVDEYVGKQVTMKGFVFREDGFPDDRMVVGRFGISCCVADGGIYGLLIQGNGEDFNQYKNDTWVEITGTVKKVEHNNWELPMIEPTDIKTIDVPKEPYVYEEFEFAG
ncbi:TIGR03943 family protein [Halobacillus andaensis]|uniref:TIGR03943 family protein n=1 Tax=Halobacillus andaensis TaxID=1176239 RepID=A0A917B653_HALAA|nr:TIGR03943 family protein [Halobacillus andaensis]MBP2005953.1 putative membrane protein [Halobacillus andaensis]GGF24757.1 TIGR03943 family protein [Halobacillus andaensis]